MAQISQRFKKPSYEKPTVKGKVSTPFRFYLNHLEAIRISNSTQINTQDYNYSLKYLSSC